MKRNTLINLAVISLLASTGIQIIRNNINIGLILGGAIAFILGSYLIASLSRFVSKSFSWRYSDKANSYVLFSSWLILVLLNILGS